MTDEIHTDCNLITIVLLSTDSSMEWFESELLDGANMNARVVGGTLVQLNGSKIKVIAKPTRSHIVKSITISV